MEEEREALEAIYEGDFEAGSHPRDGLPTWRIALAGLDAALLLRLPPGYPNSDAPVPAIEFDQWPVGGDVFALRMATELRGKWLHGEGCAYEWAEHVKEALSNSPPELARGDQEGGSAGDKADFLDASRVVDAAVPATGSGCIPCDAARAGALGASLIAGGFSACGPGIYSHSDRGVTVEVGAEVSITVDGIDSEDLSDWATMQLDTDPASFGDSLVKWVAAQRSAEPGFLEEEDAAELSGSMCDFLPKPEELGVKADRQLLVYTWGKAIRKAAPADSEHNFNAGILNGRGGGADLRTMNGLSDEVQNNVASCNLFPRWISMVCAKVEHSDCRSISINCTKGRHRSVAAAEILKRLYYPNAVTKHLTIY